MTGESGRCSGEELAAGWALRALGPDEEVAFLAHLPGCARCARVVRETEEVAAVIGGAVEQHDPPPRLRARLLAAVDAEPAVPTATPATPTTPPAPAVPPVVPLRPRRHWARLATAAAAALVLLAGTAAAVRLSQLTDQVAEGDARADRYQRALSVAADPGASRTVLQSQSGDPKAVLLATAGDAAVVPLALTPNGQAEVYVVWGLTGEAPVPLATFDVPAQGGTPELLPWNAEAAAHDRYAISLEPGRTAPATPSDVVASGLVTPA
ncbi:MULTISPECIES: anti-sigma factor [Actinosynnema]|uniref:anti-sigma factor n=1 Tax=Actinosynnema TaxID=40566 RepID=UPI0020A45B87|nr:anti-sigma factor [Actinosynnema pretiosum]MCP2098994.1 Anti-sigma-K factor rskA [Actinosynnema pretiosum]